MLIGFLSKNKDIRINSSIFKYLDTSKIYEILKDDSNEIELVRETEKFWI